MCNRSRRIKSRDHISKKMENCKKSDLIVNVRKKDVRRFKAGAELSGKVNIMDVDVIEEVNETSESIEVKIKLSSESCEAAPVCED